MTTSIDSAYRHHHGIVYRTVGIAVGLTSVVLSMFGSSTIIYLVLKREKWRERPFERIMISWCLADLLASVGAMLQPFLIPSFTAMPWAVGNLSTCQFIGWLFSYNVASFMHSAAVGLFFCLTICLGWTDNKVTRVLEPWIFVVPWVVATTIGGVGALANLFYPDTHLGVCVLECHHSPEDCHRPTLHFWLGIADSYLPLFAAVSGMAFTALVYHSVYSQTKRNQRYASGISVMQLKRMRAVAIQAICYEVGFLVSFASLVVPIFLTGNDESSTKPSRLFQVTHMLLLFFFPLQGFLNMVVFVRPILFRWKDANPDQTWMWACRQMVAGRPTPFTVRTAHLRHHIQESGSQEPATETKSGSSKMTTNVPIPQDETPRQQN